MRFLFAMIAVLACGLSAAAQTVPKPVVTLRDLNGSEHRLDEYRGKIVIFNFWATWCLPCKEEMPLLVDVQRLHPGQIIVIGASLDAPDTQRRIPKYISKYKVEFPIWIGADGSHMQELGLGSALPATAFIDADGKVVGRVLGQLKKRELLHRVAWLLGDHTGREPKQLENNLD
jgi:thiol-disulfide isomerase/thioredoxin